MSFQIGIVGLPNVGKSTLFNAITKSKVEAAKLIPFNFTIKLTPQQYRRVIIARNPQGKIIRSAPVKSSSSL